MSKTANSSGLLAVGTCGQWTVELDEKDDGKLSLTIERCNYSLNFEVIAKSVIYDLWRFFVAKPEKLIINSKISFVWDNEEDIKRCFIKIKETDCTIDIALHRSDIVDLGGAVANALLDLDN